MRIEARVHKYATCLVLKMMCKEKRPEVAGTYLHAGKNINIVWQYYKFMTQKGWCCLCL